MADEIVRETIGVKLARLEEKVDSLLKGQLDLTSRFDEVDKEMNERISALEKDARPLTILVNKITDVVDKLVVTMGDLTKRIVSLEDTRRCSDSERRGELKVYKAVVAILGIGVSVTTIMWLIGVFFHIY